MAYGHVMHVRWIVVGLVALAGCKDPTRGTSDGREIYQSMCSSCHGQNGKPPEAMISRLGVRDLTDPEVRARLTPAHVAQQVRQGSQNKLMPSFGGALSDAQIEAVSRFVASPELLAR